MKQAWNRLAPRQRSLVASSAIAIISVGAGFGLATLGESGGSAPSDEEQCEVLYWYDPMVPDQHFDEPGKSPFMDMQLVAKCAGEDAGGKGVRIDPSLVQNFGIRTVEAQVGILEPTRTVTGTIAYNGRDVSIVQPRAGGFVQRTYGHAPDDIVRRGAPIVDILVPEWGGAQQEYLAARASGDDDLTAAARERLRLLGMSEGSISSVARSGRARNIFTVTAPTSGAITRLDVRPGMTVGTGQTLAEISGLNPVWLEAAVPETLAAEVRVGQQISATLPAYGDAAFGGRITAILPSADISSRTITVRAELRNPELRLKPGMFANVSLQPDTRQALLVPTEAVIRTGTRTLVMIEQEEGRFRPAAVRTGREAGGRTEILAGLAAGEKVVVSGQFLLDSEASLAGLDVRPIDEAPDGGRNAEEGPAPHRGTGTIQAIGGGSVTLDHGPVASLEWPAMTMKFVLPARVKAGGLKQGDRVTFTFVQAQAGPTIRSIGKAGGQ